MFILWFVDTSFSCVAGLYFSESLLFLLSNFSVLGAVLFNCSSLSISADAFSMIGEIGAFISIYNHDCDIPTFNSLREYYF